MAGVGNGDGAVTSAVTRGFESSGAPHDKHNRAVSGTLFPQEAHLSIGFLPFARSPPCESADKNNIALYACRQPPPPRGARHKSESRNPLDVARASRPLSRERPARAKCAGRMPTPQRAGRPRYRVSPPVSRKGQSLSFLCRALPARLQLKDHFGILSAGRAPLVLSQFKRSAAVLAALCRLEAGATPEYRAARPNEYNHATMLEWIFCSETNL